MFLYHFAHSPLVGYRVDHADELSKMLSKGYLVESTSVYRCGRKVRIKKVRIIPTVGTDPIEFDKPSDSWVVFRIDDGKMFDIFRSSLDMFEADQQLAKYKKQLEEGAINA